MYKYIHTCIYIRIYMSAHIHTYTYILTHIKNLHVNANKHAWNDGTAANVQGAVADEGSSAKTRENGCENRFLSSVRSAAMRECEN